VVKPFSPAELVARVDAVLRRMDTSPEAEDPLRFDGLCIDPAARRVLVDGEEAALTQREFDLLLFLAKHPGQVFSRNQLMDAVWQYSFYSDTSTVTVHIRRLRSKVEPAGRRGGRPSSASPDGERAASPDGEGEPRWIQTVWGVGYRFSP